MLIVVAASAAANGMVVKVKLDDGKAALKPFQTRAEIAVVAQSPDDMRKLALDSGWRTISPVGERTWTDDYSNILGALLQRSRGH